MLEENKAMVRRLVEGINAGDMEVVDELFAPRAARRTKRLFAEFYSAFPDWREENVELVAEGDTVAGRFRCKGTHRGDAQLAGRVAAGAGLARGVRPHPRRGGDADPRGTGRPAHLCEGGPDLVVAR